MQSEIPPPQKKIRTDQQIEKQKETIANKTQTTIKLMIATKKQKMSTTTQPKGRTGAAAGRPGQLKATKIISHTLSALLALSLLFNTTSAYVTVPKPAKPAPAQADTLNYFTALRLVKQPDSMDCWAAALTMLYSWKNQDNSPGIDDVISQYGEPDITLFRTNAGITSDDELKLYQKANLQVIQGANPTVGGWYDLLNNYGPLSISIGILINDPAPQTIIHAIVVNGLHGDGSVDGTTVDFVDPGDGQQHHLSFSSFLTYYDL